MLMQVAICNSSKVKVMYFKLDACYDEDVQNAGSLPTQEVNNMIKIALIQRSADGTKEHNREESLFLARKAADQFHGLDMIVFPEYNAGVAPSPDRAYEIAEEIDGPYVSSLRRLAAELEVNINTGSFAERAANGKTLNTILIIDRKGQIAGRYSKIHLSDAMGFKESDYVQAGDSLGLVETDFGKLGLFVCYDMRFPELSRSLALQGADLLCVSAMWPCGNPLPPRTDHWDVLTRAAAIHNLCHVVACNQCGEVCGERPFGRSCVVDPWGTVLAQSGAGTNIVYAELNMDYQRDVRASVATYENRRPEFYRY